MVFEVCVGLFRRNVGKVALVAQPEEILESDLGIEGANSGRLLRDFKGDAGVIGAAALGRTEEVTLAVHDHP
jgi:hypothetical protein